MPYQLAWGRWESYRDGPNGWIYPQANDFNDPLYRRSYDPGQELALPSELARVGKEKKETIKKALMDFYRRFGMLGQTQLRSPPNNTVLDGVDHFADGDQIGWALATALNV